MSNLSNDKIQAVREQFASWEVEGVLITQNHNYRWLSGFTGSSCVLLITAAQALLGTDFRYWEQAERQAPGFTLVKMGQGENLATMSDLIRQAGVAKLGVEGNQMSVFAFNDLQKKLADKEIVTQLVPLEKTLEPLRYKKSAAELDLIREAASITDWAMSQVNEIARPGMTESDLAWELEKMMREQGAEGLAFDIIVASGPNSALAHHHPGGRTLAIGDAIVVDMGARVDGYHSDLTRTFHLGSKPDEKFWQVYNLVLEAHTQAMTHMKAGMTGKEIDALARDVIKAAGHGDDFGHSLGHGVGLFIHEEPRLSWVNDKPVPAGSVVTVEPGVYLSGWGGVRIEDLVVLGENGPELLSHCPKTPIIHI